ncbi:MAG: D-alanyl-D-alanine carboxypeptidase family protein [Oscillospiraceae bacterium]|jgi:D-alanyl-D-alanine carboxypeptidase (penicillin-binding protein 5/6)
MKKLKFIPLFAIIFVLFFSPLAPEAAALEDPDVGAKAVILLETETGDIIYSKNPDERMYPASLTKIMTILMAVEAVEAGQVSLYDVVTASENIGYNLIEDGSTAGIVPGESMTLENLMYCALVASANEACNVIAEYIGGNIPSFIDMMNARAKELGCKDTHFANAHGLHDENHYTTARDMCLITQAAISHSLFMDLCNTPVKEIPATNVSPTRTLSNTNGLINKDSYYKGYYYEYAQGVKTGYTSNAGYCLISTATKDNIHLLCVVMGGVATDKGNGVFDYGNFSDSIKLYEWAFSNFSYQEVLKSTELIAEVPLEMGSDADSVAVRPQRSITYLLPNDMDMDTLHREIVIYNERDGVTLKAPVDAGNILGEIKILKDGKVIGSTYLVAATSVSLSKSYYLKSEIAKVFNNIYVKLIFWALVVLFCGYLALVIRYRILRRRHLRSLRAARMARDRARVESSGAALKTGAAAGSLPRNAGQQRVKSLQGATSRSKNVHSSLERVNDS